VKVDGSGGAKPPEKARAAPARRPFGEALRTASLPARPGAARLPSPEGALTLPTRSAASRRVAADRADDALRSRRETFHEEARLAPPPPLPAARPPEAVTTPELRALVRTLPLAIQTFGVRDGAPLALSFGRSLDVEIRPAARGVEVVLRPEPRLARASEAELPGLVAALAAKGIAVARAEVRARGAGGAGERRPLVDLAAGLR
jgi:hypothetical protein